MLTLIVYHHNLVNIAPNYKTRPALERPAPDGSRENTFDSFRQTSNDERGRRTRPIAATRRALERPGRSGSKESHLTHFHQKEPGENGAEARKRQRKARERLGRKSRDTAESRTKEKKTQSAAAKINSIAPNRTERSTYIITLFACLAQRFAPGGNHRY
jgi:hypothetical protein